MATVSLVASRVPHRVADRFLDHGFGMLGQCSLDHRQRSLVLHGGVQIP